MSQPEAAKSALCTSAVLLWDVSGERQERGAPPTFSARASRSGLLSAWARYERPLKVTPLPRSERLADNICLGVQQLEMR